MSLTREKLVPQSVQRLTSMVQCLKACSAQTHDFRSPLPTFPPALISLRSKHSSVDMYLTELTDKLAHSLTHECKVSKPMNPTLIHPYRVGKTNHLSEISDYRDIFSYGLVFYGLVFQGLALWSSGQSSWLNIQRFGFDSLCYQIF
jgi:hypothetical protein